MIHIELDTHIGDWLVIDVHYVVGNDTCYMNLCRTIRENPYFDCPDLIDLTYYFRPGHLRQLMTIILVKIDETRLEPDQLQPYAALRRRIVVIRDGCRA
jgi:hypothetical protein